MSENTVIEKDIIEEVKAPDVVVMGIGVPFGIVEKSNPGYIAIAAIVTLKSDSHGLAALKDFDTSNVVNDTLMEQGKKMVGELIKLTDDHRVIPLSFAQYQKWNLAQEDE